jgi:periplasmic divalent cation tolerance protein
LTTAGSDAQADGLARALVERRLAACVNVVSGVCSVYRWKGDVEREDERLLMIKSDRVHFEALRLAIRELHSYQTPEIVALPLVASDPDYLAWLEESLKSP